MNPISTILLYANSYSILDVIAIAFFGAVAGFVFKWGLLAKNRKKILGLEDEMLANHSQILTLQKRNTELEQENKRLQSNNKNTETRTLKAS